MAATSRRTGAPTGCIAKRSRCWTCIAQRRRRRRLRRARSTRSGAPARDAAAGHAHQHLRCGIGRRHRQRRARAGDRCGQRAFPRPVRRRTPEAQELREQYAFPVHATLTPDEADALNAFFFWTAWAASTNRPGQDDHLHQQLAARATGRQHADRRGVHVDVHFDLRAARPASARWSGTTPRNSTSGAGIREPETGFAKRRLHGRRDGDAVDARYRAGIFMVVVALFVAQVVLGIVTAHYAVEGQGLYGLPLSDYFPYSVTRTWHTQLAVLWIATAWLATGLYVAPLLGGRDPKFQRAASGFCSSACWSSWSASFAGEWLAINRVITDLTHQFLVRPSGLRVRGPRPLLADLSVHRPAAVGACWCCAALWPALKQQAQSRSLLVPGRGRRRSRSVCCSARA